MSTLYDIVVCVCIMPARVHVCVYSGELSFTLWDHWEIRGGKDFKLADFLKAVNVSSSLTIDHDLYIPGSKVI